MLAGAGKHTLLDPHIFPRPGETPYVTRKLQPFVNKTLPFLIPVRHAVISVRGPTFGEQYWELCSLTVGIKGSRQEHTDVPFSYPETLASGLLGHIHAPGWMYTSFNEPRVAEQVARARGSLLLNSDDAAGVFFEQHYQPLISSGYYGTAVELLRPFIGVLRGMFPHFREWQNENWFELYPGYDILPVPWGPLTSSVSRDKHAALTRAHGRAGVIFALVSDTLPGGYDYMESLLHEFITLGIRHSIHYRFRLTQVEKNYLVHVLRLHLRGFQIWKVPSELLEFDRYLRDCFRDPAKRPDLLNRVEDYIRDHPRELEEWEIGM